jgi:hypothetical protein
MTSIESHNRMFGGSPRPRWAGSVQAVSRERGAGPNLVNRSTELSGVVLPISVPTAPGQLHTFGQQLGFPHLAEQLPDMDPEVWKSWSRFEQVVGQAATGIMGWKRPQSHQGAIHTPMPANALHLRLTGRTVQSTPAGAAQPSFRSSAISGEISKVFNISDVSGSQHRFESAGSSASFRVVAGAVHWSRDPRSL